MPNYTHRFVFLTGMTLLASRLSASHRIQTGFAFEHDGHTLEIEAYTERIVHVVYRPVELSPSATPWLPRPEVRVPFAIDDDTDFITLSTGRVVVRM